jgi:hypothetical protein
VGCAGGDTSEFSADMLLVTSLKGVVAWKNARMLPGCTASPSPFFFRGMFCGTNEGKPQKKFWRENLKKYFFSKF